MAPLVSLQMLDLRACPQLAALPQALSVLPPLANEDFANLGPPSDAYAAE